MIPFNLPLFLGHEGRNIEQVLASRKLCGDGAFTAKCNRYLEKETGAHKALLTSSCTHALEMAAALCNIKPGDEVILPSYTFVSTANAFVLRGARVIFIDIRPDTMNIDETLIEAAITPKTRAICVVHYAGVSCEMTPILELAKKHNVYVIEDAAQALASTYHGQPCGTMGDAGCLSFHETKNITCGEGGSLLLRNSSTWAQRAEIIREKGTNRSQFHRGEIDKYTWVDEGSSYLPSELNAAYLAAQLENLEMITENRRASFAHYQALFYSLEQAGRVSLPFVPKHCVHNAHMFYLKCKNLEERTRLIAYLREQGIFSVFHYIPLHSSPAGKRYGTFVGEDRFTTKESERLVRLPMYYGLEPTQREQVAEAVYSFFSGV